MVDGARNMSTTPTGPAGAAVPETGSARAGDGAVGRRGARQRRAPLGSDFGLVEHARSQ